MVKELFGRLDNFMTSTLIDNLKEEDMEEFIKLSEESKSKEDIEEFIHNKIPDAQEVMSQAMTEFRNTYLDGAIDSRNAPPFKDNDDQNSLNRSNSDSRKD